MNNPETKQNIADEKVEEMIDATAELQRANQEVRTAQVEVALERVIAKYFTDEKSKREPLGNLLSKHFKDDEVSFAKIHELMEISGGHLSYFNKNLDEVKVMLIEQNKVSSKQWELMEPVIADFKRNTEGIAYIKSKGGIAIYLAGALITLSAGWYVVKNFLINLK